MTKSLEERVEALRTQPLAQPFPYVYLDATFLDARWARAVQNVERHERELKEKKAAEKSKNHNGRRANGRYRL